MQILYHVYLHVQITLIHNESSFSTFQGTEKPILLLFSLLEDTKNSKSLS